MHKMKIIVWQPVNGEIVTTWVKIEAYEGFKNVILHRGLKIHGVYDEREYTEMHQQINAKHN